MKYKITLFSIASLFTISCGHVNSNEPIIGNLYRNNDIGWSIQIPTGYEVTVKDLTGMDPKDPKAKERFEEVRSIAGQDFEINELKTLIKFKKGINSFLASIEPIKEDEYYNKLRKEHQLLTKSLIEMGVKKGIKIDTFSGKEIIQGLEFDTFTTTLQGMYNNVRRKICMVSFDKFYKNLEFNAGVSYFDTDEVEKKILLDAWKNSKFESTKN